MKRTTLIILLLLVGVVGLGSCGDAPRITHTGVAELADHQDQPIPFTVIDSTTLSSIEVGDVILVRCQLNNDYSYSWVGEGSATASIGSIVQGYERAVVTQKPQ